MVFKCSLSLTDAHTIQEASENSKCVVTARRVNSLKQYSEVIYASAIYETHIEFAYCVKDKV